MRRRIIRKSTATATLDAPTEVAAAGLLWTWCGFVGEEWGTRRFWHGIGHAHGERLDAKVREAFPGCRPGYRYGRGDFPPVPLVEELPADHIGQREYLDVDGVRHWFVGQPYQRCQAEHLRELGELDGAEWRRFVAWRDAGLPARYTLDDGAGGPCGAVFHGCWGVR
jgi:hypothetical protein